MFESDSINIVSGFLNSLWYTLFSVVITLFTSAVCGYVFSRGVFRGKKLLFAVFSALMFISMGSITVYPQMKIVSLFHIDKSLAGVLVIKLFGIPIVNMYIIKSFVDALPKELDESAKIEGCTFSGIFARIIAPMLKPALATLGILSFKGSWNEYFYPAIFTMTSPKKQPLMVQIMALKNSGAGASNWPLLFMASVIMIIPILIIFLIFNREITESVTAGAIKG